MLYVFVSCFVGGRFSVVYVCNDCFDFFSSSFEALMRILSVSAGDGEVRASDMDMDMDMHMAGADADAVVILPRSFVFLCQSEPLCVITSIGIS